MRKLADYAFMLRDWKFAHSIYDLLRKDFLNDKAWMYHAGSQVGINYDILIASVNEDI